MKVCIFSMLLLTTSFFVDAAQEEIIPLPAIEGFYQSLNLSENKTEPMNFPVLLILDTRTEQIITFGEAKQIFPSLKQDFLPKNDTPIPLNQQELPFNQDALDDGKRYVFLNIIVVDWIYKTLGMEGHKRNLEQIASMRDDVLLINVLSGNKR